MITSANSQIELNKTRTWIIMVFFTLFIAMVVFILSKASGYGISWALNALVISGVMSIGSYFWGDKMILAMSGAQEADKLKDVNLYHAVEHVARLTKIPIPKVYIMEDQAPNAFATGRDPQHSAVCATRGILQMLTQSELEAVIAHEISHIQNYDTRVLAVVTVLVGMIVFLSDWFMRMLWWGGGRHDREDKSGIGSILMLVGIILAILSPIIATIIQLAISRRREFLADASGALITKNPDSLAAALVKISSDRNVLHKATNATAHLFIVNPFKGKDKSAWFTGLFNTHPPVEERIKILHEM